MVALVAAHHTDLQGPWNLSANYIKDQMRAILATYCQPTFLRFQEGEIHAPSRKRLAHASCLDGFVSRSHLISTRTLRASVLF